MGLMGLMGEMGEMGETGEMERQGEGPPGVRVQLVRAFARLLNVKILAQ